MIFLKPTRHPPPAPLPKSFSHALPHPQGELRFVQRCTARLTPPAARGSTPPVALMAVAARQWGGPSQGEADDGGGEPENDEGSGGEGAEARGLVCGATAAAAPIAPLLPAEELTRQLAAALMPDRASETRCGPAPLLQNQVWVFPSEKKGMCIPPLNLVWACPLPPSPAALCPSHSALRAAPSASNENYYGLGRALLLLPSLPLALSPQGPEGWPSFRQRSPPHGLLPLPPLALSPQGPGGWSSVRVCCGGQPPTPTRG